MRKIKGPSIDLSGKDDSMRMICPKCAAFTMPYPLPLLESDLRFECPNHDCDYEYPESAPDSKPEPEEKHESRERPYFEIRKADLGRAGLYDMIRIYDDGSWQAVAWEDEPTEHFVSEGKAKRQTGGE